MKAGVKIWNELSLLTDRYKNLNLHEIIDYERFSMISVMWHSTKIEGCSLTENDTKVLLDKDITAPGKPLADHLMIKDHFAAYNYIIEEAKNKRKFSIDFLTEIGGRVMKNTGANVSTISGDFDTSKGDLRLAQVYVDKKYFPDYSKVPVLLKDLCEYANSKIDAVEDVEILKLAADIHYNFVNIHPFGDGNGRAARLLMNYVQLYHSEPLIKVFTEDRVNYIEALNITEEQNNPELFREFIASQQIKFLKLELEKYKNIKKGFNLLF